MGLFNLFGRKKSSRQADENPQEKSSLHQRVVAELHHQLLAQGFDAKISKHATIDLSPELRISVGFIRPVKHHLLLLDSAFGTVHDVFLPAGILEFIVGSGETEEERAWSVVHNYLTTILPPILDSLSDIHDPNLDFSDATGRLWHPKPGTIALQGRWPKPWPAAQVWEVISPSLKAEIGEWFLPKINWLKVHATRSESGEVEASCVLNDVRWDNGTDALHQAAASWPEAEGVIGMKQFVSIRRCDAFD